MILGPLSAADNSADLWEWNSQGVTGTVLDSENGGFNWSSNGASATLGAFDITSTPEPATWPALIGLASVCLWQRLRKRSAA